MWQTPNQRARAVANQKKREREKLRRRFHVTRVIAQIEKTPQEGGSDENKAVPVRVILNDLSIKGVGVFSHHPLVAGMEVNFKIVEPVEIILPAKIVWCQAHDSDTHVLSQEPYAYRMGLSFHPSEEQLENLKAVLDTIFKTHIFRLKPKVA